MGWFWIILFVVFVVANYVKFSHRYDRSSIRATRAISRATTGYTPPVQASALRRRFRL